MKKKSWVPAVFAIGLALPVQACSFAKATTGIADVSDIPLGSTRSQIHDRFGEPVWSAACRGGTRVEIHQVTRKVVRSGPRREAVSMRFRPSGLVRLFVNPATYVPAEGPEMDVAFVYGADDSLLFRSEVAAVPEGGAPCESLNALEG